MKLFKNFDPGEETEFRRWARANYKPFSPISDVWHPVVQDECTKINTEADLKVPTIDLITERDKAQTIREKLKAALGNGV
jgi:hypothetical protein